MVLIQYLPWCERTNVRLLNRRALKCWIKDGYYEIIIILVLRLFGHFQTWDSFLLVFSAVISDRPLFAVLELWYSKVLVTGF